MLDVKIEGAAKLARTAEDLAQARARVREAVSRASTDFANAAVTTMKEDYLSGKGGKGRESVGVFTGRLRSSIRYLVAEEDDAVSIVFGSDVPYAAAWEFGRPPGKFPPSGPLARWAQLVLGVPAKEAKGVGFLIARSIARRGQKERPFLRPGVEDNVPEFQQRLGEVLEAAAVGRFGGE